MARLSCVKAWLLCACLRVIDVGLILNMFCFCGNGVAALCARSKWPSSARCEQKLSRNNHPLPVRSRVRLHRNGEHAEKEKAGQSWQNDAAEGQKASRAGVDHRRRSDRARMAGWAGRWGRCARAAEYGSMEDPLPPSSCHVPSTQARHRSLANASRETACHHESPARNGHHRQHGAARHQTRQPGSCQPRNSSAATKARPETARHVSTARFATTHVSP